MARQLTEKQQKFVDEMLKTKLSKEQREAIRKVYKEKFGEKKA